MMKRLFLFLFLFWMPAAFGAGTASWLDGVSAVDVNNLPAITSTGDVTGTNFIATGDTAAGDAANVGFTSAEGLILTGQGSTNDLTVKNDADASVAHILTGTVVWSFDDQVQAVGSDPTFAGDGCGTSPAVVGSDMAGKITVGTTVTTSCAMTFATAYANAPACVVTGDINATLYSAVSTTTILTITSSADMDSDVVMFICIGL